MGSSLAGLHLERLGGAFRPGQRAKAGAGRVCWEGQDMGRGQGCGGKDPLELNGA